MIALEGAEILRGDFRLRLDLQVAGGERVAVLGASGSGKSTMLDALAGFVPLASGELRLDGTPMRDVPPQRRPVSILFQDGNLLPTLSVAENVALGLRPDLRLGAAEWGRVRDVLAAVDLAALADRRPASLSGGQQTRAALARILLRERPIVLMDEPFAALDPGLRSDMIALVDRLLGRARTLVLVTHDAREAAALCARLILLQDGVVACDGPIASLKDHPPASLRPWLLT